MSSGFRHQSKVQSPSLGSARGQHWEAEVDPLVRHPRDACNARSFWRRRRSGVEEAPVTTANDRMEATNAFEIMVAKVFEESCDEDNQLSNVRSS
mmetsp:Transcript_2262/g.5583  ORF Transcript_2262/g.5583 Transcript_2262/m.5583 type:complete len:95 (+) Transcript_2262:748-1032(+)